MARTHLSFAQKKAAKVYIRFRAHGGAAQAAEWAAEGVRPLVARQFDRQGLARRPLAAEECLTCDDNVEEWKADEADESSTASISDSDSDDGGAENIPLSHRDALSAAHQLKTYVFSQGLDAALVLSFTVFGLDALGGLLEVLQ
ncbi:hypothetical protein BBJ28_00015528 [Nothophytophthora sp. Chile5]|nr:hypothetical protein BBJ28_00015528 [Nothophytophthora sp. Chile5]